MFSVLMDYSVIQVLVTPRLCLVSFHVNLDRPSLILTDSPFYFIQASYSHMKHVIRGTIKNKQYSDTYKCIDVK